MMTSAKRSSHGGRHRMLTPRRRRMVQFIEEYLHDRGCSPTNREIADGAGLASVSGVSYHLQTLKAAGIHRWPGSLGLSLEHKRATVS